MTNKFLFAVVILILFTQTTSAQTSFNAANQPKQLFKFLNNNTNKTVQLNIVFDPDNEPYDYRGESGLWLWSAQNNAFSWGGIFFKCSGSWDNRTGHAKYGKITGKWQVQKKTKLDGQYFHNLVCIK